MHQVCVCCWSTRGQPNNDELLWITQKWPVLKMLLSNLVDSPCWDCCSVCAGSLFFYLHRLIPTDSGSSKKISLAVDARLYNYRKKEIEAREISRQTYCFYKAKQIPCTVLCHRENPACCCWISHRHDIMVGFFFHSVQEMLRGTERSVCLGNV